MEEKKQDGDIKNDIPPKVMRTVSNEEIKKLYEKAVRTHGKTLERLSKN